MLLPTNAFECTPRVRPRSGRTRSCRHSGFAQAPPTESRGRCSRRSTRSSPTSAATWGPAPPAQLVDAVHAGHVAALGTTVDGDGFADPWDPEDAVFAAARYLAAAGGNMAHLHAPYSPTTTPSGTWTTCLRLASLFGGDVDVAFTLDKLAIKARGGPGRGCGNQRSAAGGRVGSSGPRDPASGRLTQRASSTQLLLSDRLDVDRQGIRGRRGASAAATAEVERFRAPVGDCRGTARRGPHRRPRSVFQPAGCGSRSRRPEPRGRLRVPGRRRLRPTSASGTTITTIRPRTSPPRKASRPSRSPTRSRSPRSTAAAAVSESFFRRVTGSSGLDRHLSQRDAAVVPGTSLVAGQWVGLVGSTGHSTGPHLHLALKPETPLPAGHAVVPGVCWDRLRCGRDVSATAERFRSSPVFAAVPTEDARRRRDRVHYCPFKGLSFMPFLPRKAL